MKFDIEKTDAGYLVVIDGRNLVVFDDYMTALIFVESVIEERD